MSDTLDLSDDLLERMPRLAPVASDRVRDLLAQMSLDEKLAQLVGFWVDEGGAVVAPLQDEMVEAVDLERFAANGLGHLTRVFGTAPVDPIERAAWLRAFQRHLVANTRLGIPAIAHEECLTGLAAWRATTFPTPLAWGAAFDPGLVERMGAAIGESMAAIGVHQGLSPVLDVIRDPRWGRVEECISEDPYLVGTLGSAYVRGLQSQGIVATLKHFVGYSASKSGRNLAPVSAGPREVADTLLIPFEMAVLDAGARSVMPSYAEIDGVPVAADPALLTGLLRERWGFDGTVVADYFEVAFLHSLHQVAPDLGRAAAAALAAGVDIELPTGDAYLEPLAALVRAGAVEEGLVDRAVVRVLAEKERLGLLDATFAEPEGDAAPIDLDPPAHRAIAAELAEASVILLANDGVLPLAAPGRIAVIGPNADRSAALFGCYSFTNHVLGHHPEVPMGIAAPTVLEALRAASAATDGPLAGAVLVHEAGCAVDDADRSGIPDAVAAAAGSELAIVVVGDQAGLFGRGTVGEGCDRDDLELPGVQRELVEAVLATGTPVVLVLLTGRPYVIDWALEGCAAVVQSFFPGEEGAAAIVRVLGGEVNPSGRLPVTMPRSAGAQPFTYLHPTLGAPSNVSTVATTPVLPFGFGLSYTSFEQELVRVRAEVPTDSSLEASVAVTNTGDRAGAHVVQLYARDEYASVTRPLSQLVAYARVHLEPGERCVVDFVVPATRLAFSGVDLARIVEPGSVLLAAGESCTDLDRAQRVELTGPVHAVSVDDERMSRATVRDV
ncbi:glycoside hydrolase family 3 N-terminal domain-containing protein [Agromyces sp. NPDC058110]|uniref:beta-xylosidase/alpha-l-arabinosidase n=1 Tax=Agromyces sp. NPDC058110 TaxID=3346345 RepID=UPI0036DD463E